MNTISDKAERVRAAFAGFAEGRAEPLLNLLDEAVSWTVIGNAPLSGTYRGRQALVDELLVPLAQRLDGHLVVTIDRMTATADTVVVQGRGRSRTRTGRDYNNTYCWVFVFRHDSIIEVTEYLDTEILRQAFG